MCRLSCGRYFSRAFVRTLVSFLLERGEKSPHPTVYFLHLPIFEFAVVFYLMRTRHASKNGTDLQPRTGKDLVVSHNQRSRVNIIVWGLHKDLTTLEVHAKLADMGLESFVRGNVLWEGDHIRLVLTKKDSKGVSSKLVKQVSVNLRKLGCRCVIDEQVRKSCKSRVMSVPVHCVSRFESLAVDTYSDDKRMCPLWIQLRLKLRC